jgi:hypothetical protein
MTLPRAACKGITEHGTTVILYSCGFSGKDDHFSFYQLSSTVTVSQSTTVDINYTITGALLVMCMQAVMALAPMQSASSTVNKKLRTT